MRERRMRDSAFVTHGASTEPGPASGVPPVQRAGSSPGNRQPGRGYDAAPAGSPSLWRGSAPATVGMALPTAADLLPDPAFDPPQELQSGELPPGRAAAPSDLPTVLTKLDKWGTYTSVATGPCGSSNFIAMKTPLSHAVLEKWNQQSALAHPWTVADLLGSQAAAGRRVSLIIDLSNHETLYADEIPPSLAYLHIKLVAKELPSRAAVREVVRVADAHWRRSPHTFIAIHCAYGFNRTGFVVCSYLCEARGLSVSAALRAFAAVRPPGVKHIKFIDELYARYGSDGSPCAVESPPAAAPEAEPDYGRLSANAAAAASCASPLVPLASGMRQAKDWLLRTPSRRAAAAASPGSLTPGRCSLALSECEGLEGDDNESLQDLAAIGRTSSRLWRASPSDAASCFGSPSEADMRCKDWLPGSGGARGSLSAVCERHTEDSTPSHLLTADALTLQDAATASESRSSLRTIANSLPDMIQPPEERAPPLAAATSGQRSIADQRSSRQGNDTVKWGSTPGDQPSNGHAAVASGKLCRIM